MGVNKTSRANPISVSQEIEMARPSGKGKMNVNKTVTRGSSTQSTASKGQNTIEEIFENLNTSLFTGMSTQIGKKDRKHVYSFIRNEGESKTLEGNEKSQGDLKQHTWVKGKISGIEDGRSIASSSDAKNEDIIEQVSLKNTITETLKKRRGLYAEQPKKKKSFINRVLNVLQRIFGRGQLKQEGVYDNVRSARRDLQDNQFALVATREDNSIDILYKKDGEERLMTITSNDDLLSDSNLEEYRFSYTIRPNDKYAKSHTRSDTEKNTRKNSLEKDLEDRLGGLTLVTPKVKSKNFVDLPVYEENKSTIPQQEIKKNLEEELPYNKNNAFAHPKKIPFNAPPSSDSKRSVTQPKLYEDPSILVDSKKENVKSNEKIGNKILEKFKNLQKLFIDKDVKTEGVYTSTEKARKNLTQGQCKLIQRIDRESIDVLFWDRHMDKARLVEIKLRQDENSPYYELIEDGKIIQTLHQSETPNLRGSRKNDLDGRLAAVLDSMLEGCKLISPNDKKKKNFFL